MNVSTVMAQLIVTDLVQAEHFYTAVFGRGPDASPMDGLREWHFADAGSIQVYEEPERAGCSGATFHVDDLDATVAALDWAGVAHQPMVDATSVRLVQLSDPDHNRIVITCDKPQ